MKKLQGRFFSLLAVSILFLCSTPQVYASDDGDAREVRITSVQGDVRLSHGDGKHTNLDKSWEQAHGGELLEQGFAIATESGRAEIEFENGSTVYLAENSLLLFTELSAPRDRIVSRMSLPTGTASFALQPLTSESFFIETPTDKIEVSGPDTFFARMDAYLDATAITPQGEKGEAMVREGLPKLYIAKGETQFFQGGQSIQVAGPAQTASSENQTDWLSLRLSSIQAAALVLRESGIGPIVPGGLILQGLPFQAIDELPHSATERSASEGDWDRWVSSQVREKAAAMAAALKASGLSSSISGLNDLYRHGTFFQCAPYGTCWEPVSQEPVQASSPQAPSPMAQSSAQSAPNIAFPPQTVEWQQTTWGLCGSSSSKLVSRVARSQQELDELLRQKTTAERAAQRGTSYSVGCESGAWIFHHGHYARLVAARIPPHCVGRGCKVVHPPRPVWVRVNGKLGFVPRHPNDVKGKPPVNLKNGIIIPPAKTGEPTQHLAWDPSQRVKFLDKTPKEFHSVSTPHLPSAPAPKIQAHLMQEATHTKSLAADSHIVYDYKSHNFIMPANASAGAKSKEVAIGGITSHGGVRSFADGRSGHYAESFGHTSAAASYSGGGHNSGSSSGGGHGSGSYSSSSSYSHGGGGSGSSYSGGGGSSGSHSSGGGGSSASASSASSSSSSSSSSSGGSSHGRP
jgi:hypothetical protein